MVDHKGLAQLWQNETPCADLRRLAEESLELLKACIYDARFPALFSLEVYGSIIGMFELNNLSAHASAPLPAARTCRYDIDPEHQDGTCSACLGCQRVLGMFQGVYQAVFG